MNKPFLPSMPASLALSQDESICLEAHGLLNQSYDSLDNLLHGLTHAYATPLVDQVPAPDVTIVGQPDTLLLAHLFL
jgi:hypothetical protein